MDLTVKIVIVVLILLGLMVGKMQWDRIQGKKKLQNYLIRHWGIPESRSYTEEQWDAITGYYEDHQGTWDIDGITWNDLNMDLVYEQINHTKTSMGEERLYALLRKPLTDPEEMEERERIISYFSEQAEECLQLQMALAEIGKLEKMSVWRHLKSVDTLPECHTAKHVGEMLAMALSLLLCAVKPDIMVIVTIALLGVNIFEYYRVKAELDPCLRLFSFIVRMVAQCETVASVKVPGIEGYQKELREATKCFHRFCRGSSLVQGGQQMGGDLLDSLMDYVRMIFHVDLIKIGSMIREARRYQKQLFSMYEIIGYLDSMVSIASYRAMEEDCFVPKLQVRRDGFLAFEELRHPLLEEGVTNSMETAESVLLTGSNASGKSTFLKTVAINAILAQTIHTVLANEYRSSWFHIFSSMALRDDLVEQESYYIVEIKSLKRILDRTKETEFPILCFIDEVLRGTNTVERIASSSRILRELPKGGNLCFAATHDIELTYLLEGDYANYHFEEQVTKDEVLFDYRLRKGRANTRNAIRLLQMLGYDPAITQDAERAVQRFLETGTWQN